jgi:hypothetical protein
MKLTKFQLKQIIKEELNKTLQEMSGFMGHYMETRGGDTPESIAQALVDSGQEITERSVEAAVIEAGALDDEVEDFVDEVMVALEHIQGAY